MHLIGMMQPRIDQGGMFCVQPFHLEEFLGVLLWSLALLSVAVGELLVALGILLDIENIALVNLLHSSKQSCAVGVAVFFWHKGDLTRQQHYCSS